MDEGFVGSGDGFEVLDAFEFTFVGAVVVEFGAADNFDGAEGAEGVAAEPDFSVSARADFFQQFEFGQLGRG